MTGGRARASPGHAGASGPGVQGATADRAGQRREGPIIAGKTPLRKAARLASSWTVIMTASPPTPRRTAPRIHGAPLSAALLTLSLLLFGGLLTGCGAKA